MLPKSKEIAPQDHADHPSLTKGKTLGKSQDLPEVEAQKNLTDMEWMRERMKGGVEDATNSEKSFEQSDNEDPTVKMILSTARLFVRNLTFTCTEDELRGLFQPFGAISQVSGHCSKTGPSYV